MIRIALLAPSLHLHVPAEAQQGTTERWALHAVGAGQSVWLNDPLGTNNGPLTGRRAYGVGYLFGMGAGRPLGANSSVRAELHWNERHSRVEVDESQNTYRDTEIGSTVDVGTRSFRLRAVQMPLLYTYGAWPDLDLIAGPVFARMLAVQERFVGTRYAEDGEVDTGTVRTDRTAQFRPFELSFLLGFEVEGHAGLRFGVRYCKGLTDLERWEGASASVASAVQVVLVVPLLRSGAGLSGATH